MCVCVFVGGREGDLCICVFVIVSVCVFFSVCMYESVRVSVCLRFICFPIREYVDLR